jgi:hypothetical protein
MPHLTLKTLTCLLALSATAPRVARADDTCAKAYETAQELRADGLLRAARDVLRMCVRPSCLPFIRNDCGKWLNEVETALPTAVFVVQMMGKDLDQVAVVCDEELLTEKLDGRALAMDPGKHSCRFDSPGATSGRIDILIAEGHKNRVIEVQLQPAPAPEPAPEPEAPAIAMGPAPGEDADVEPDPPPVEPKPRRGMLLALGATTLAGVGSFLGLGLRGRLQERDLAASCAPGCTARDVSGVRASYLLADIGLAVGVASAALAGYLLITGSGPPDRPPQLAATSIWPVPLAGGAGLTIQSLF